MVIDRNEILDNIIDDIKAKYKDFTQPNFRFISKIFDKNPYNNFFDGLNCCCKIEDITDINYDVSFVYILDCPNRKYMLQLSMVGNYAAFYRLSSEREMELIEKSEVGLDSLEKAVIDALEKNNIVLLDEQILEFEINIKVNINDDKSTSSLYECLFTNKG